MDLAVACATVCLAADKACPHHLFAPNTDRNLEILALAPETGPRSFERQQCQQLIQYLCSLVSPVFVRERLTSPSRQGNHPRQASATEREP